MKLGKSRIRIMAIVAVVTVAAVVLAAAVSSIRLSKSTAIDQDDLVNPVNAAAIRVTPELLSAMRWNDMGNVVATITTNSEEIGRVAGLIDDMSTPVTLYLKALLLLAQNQPKQALGVFNQIQIDRIPPNFLYAPHRLHQVINGTENDKYRELLEKAVNENQTSALITARVLAANGALEDALSSYLQSDPASWASYDLVLFRRIGSYEGLSVDLARMLTGAISSGRAKADLVPQLAQIARQPADGSEIADFENRIRNAIKNDTPEGRIALESARNLLRDRKIFLSRQYQELIKLYSAAKPIKLSTETVLLLFLSSVELQDQEQAETWGQELKRRHGETEVRDWVNKTMGTA